MTRRRIDLDSEQVSELISLYDAASKHGSYHPAPEFLSSHLPNLGSNPKWRSPVPRTRLLQDRLASVPSGTTVVELGSNSGYQLLELAANHPTLTFVGVEMNPNHATFTARAAEIAGLGNCSVVETAMTPMDVASAWPESVMLDFNVAHHAGADFPFGRTTDVQTWWESGVARWLSAVPHFSEYWFSSGFRWAGRRGFELCDPEDPTLFASRIVDALNAVPFDLDFYAVDPCSRDISYSRLCDSQELNQRLSQCRKRSLFEGEYFARPLLHFTRPQ